MDPGPKVVISEFVLKVTDDKSSILPHGTRFSVEFLRNGKHFGESSPMMRNDNGCLPVINVRLILPATDLFVIDVLKVDADRQSKLGSFYLDLEDVLQTHSDLISMDDAIMDSNEFPAMQLTLKASSFPLLPASELATGPIPTFLAFEICSEVTTDADIMMYSRELGQLPHTNTFLILDPGQFEKLRDRCLALGSAYDRLFILTLFAGFLHNDFHALSNRLMYTFSRYLYQDLSAAFGDLRRSMQLDLASALTSLPDTDATKTIRMQAFAGSFMLRYNTTGDEDDLTQCISLLEAVVQLQAGPYSNDFILDQFMAYSSMYSAYNTRYELSNNVLDLDMALAALNKAIELPLPWWTPVGTRPGALHALAKGLGNRSIRLGAEHDLERAMECVDEALAGVLVDSPEHLEYHRTRWWIKVWRFCYFRKMFDFEQNKEMQERAITIMKDWNRPVPIPASEDVLAELLLDRLLRTRTYGEFIEQPIADRDESVAAFRYRRASGEADLGREIDVLVDCRRDIPNSGIIQLAPLPPVSRAIEEGNKANLDEAIADFSSMSDDFMLGGALSLRYRRYGRHPEDLHSAISAFSDAATSFTLDPKKRLSAAQFWFEHEIVAITELGEDRRFQSVMYALQTMMSIMPSIVWMGMAMQDRHNILTTTMDSLRFDAAQQLRILGAFALPDSTIGQIPNRAVAFAVAFGELHTAIEWLEQGHSIIWDQLLQFRVPLDNVWQQDPGLAQKLAALAKDLSKSSTMTHFWRMEVAEDGRETKIPREAEGQKHRRLATEWHEAVADARKLPGSDKFLLPKDFDYLSKAANDGIVVMINVYMWCDALIIFPAPSGSCTKKDILHVHLPDLTLYDVEQMHADLLCLIRDDVGIRSELTRRPVLRDFLAGRNASFKKILGDLWYKIVLPILCEAMEHRSSLVNCDEGEKRAHVRWYPTGHLAFLPLHAAGDYSLSGKGHRVFDFVVSSYIPTLNSVIQSTPPTSSQDTVMDSTVKVLAVACPYAKGQVSIPDTEEEVRRVGKLVAPLLDQPATLVSRYSALVKKSATAEQVLEEMKEATWVHLACHGIQDATTPTRSALLLSDGSRLLLSDIVALDLPQAEFAFLSACQTATGYDKVPSESVHLAAGMLLAGYRSVIGTMWSIADRHAPHVADDVYGYLLRDGTARRPDYKESALALHLAMQRLRARIGEGSFLQWVPYIHIGA